MDAQTFLTRLLSQSWYEGQAVHIRELPARPARYAEVPGGLHPLVESALRGQCIERLYMHQAQAIDHLRQGRNVVIVTGTASGKTLCYVIPVVEAITSNPLSTALFVYPTKALAQDQLRALGTFTESDAGIEFLAGTYDGDTPRTLRTRLRNTASIILTNPDMLHQGILPQHARWSRFFSHLRYVVIDEVHAYRGVFGSHLANVMRRLARICRHHGAAPQFICCSATIGNPGEHAQRITGERMEVVDDDGSPRGPKRVVIWNPPPLSQAARGAEQDWRTGGDRRSALAEAVELMASLVREDVQTIAFVRTRLSAELLFKGCRDRLARVSPRLARAVQAYRGGYLPEERRAIEQALASRQLLAVSSTNALELGIDIGTLDACILVGYPGSIASLWQRAGRAGRGQEEALVFFVAQNSPMDQYLAAHPDYIFGKSPEHAVVDPDNPHIVVGHLRCAMHELPLADEEADLFGPYARDLLDLLEEEGFARHIDGRWYWASSDYPAADVNLRNIPGPIYTIQDESEGGRIVGTMDEVSALSQLHDHAVYIHAGETYLVDKLDLEQKIAFVRKTDLDYYTQSVQVSQIMLDEVEERAEWGKVELGYGDVTVVTSIPMFKKIRFERRESAGYEELDLPPQRLETVAMWLVPPDDAVAWMRSRGLVVGEALAGIANAMVEVVPLFLMCDVQDVGAAVDASCLGRDALFFYDRYPGGMGYARRCMERIGEVLEAVREVIARCGCDDGCPSCVGAPMPPHAMTDLDRGVRERIPSKRGAQALLDFIFHTAQP